jgi:hypothetical protein
VVFLPVSRFAALQDSNSVLNAKVSLRLDGIDLFHKLHLLIFCPNKSLSSSLRRFIKQAKFFRKLNAQPKALI